MLLKCGYIEKEEKEHIRLVLNYSTVAIRKSCNTSNKIHHYISIACTVISNGNRTEWSPIRSVIIRVITKSDDRAAGVRFVYHEYDYRPNWTTRSPIAN